MKKTIYGWLNLPDFSSQMAIRLAIKQKQAHIQTNNIKITEALQNAITVAERLAGDKVFYEKYNQALRDKQAQPIPLQQNGQEKGGRLAQVAKQKLTQEQSPRKFLKGFYPLQFEVCLPIALVISYVSLQFAMASGIFSPSLESTLKAVWKLEARSTNAGFPEESCVSLLSNVSFNDFSWTRFLVKELPSDASYYETIGRRAEQQFNLLEKAGFLEKLDGSVKIKVMLLGQGKNRGDEVVEAYPYRVTAKANGYMTERRGFCINYGTPQFLSIDSVDKVSNEWMLNRYREKFEDVQEVVEVTASAGYKSTDDFYPWARNPDVIQAFDLEKEMKKKSRKVVMVKINNEWFHSKFLDDPRAMANWIHFRNVGQHKEIYRVYQDALDSGHYPYQSKIKGIFDKKFAEQHYGNSYWWYVPIPGDSKYRVDIEHSSRCRSPYLVGIFLDTLDDDRPNRDAITKTLPYLKDLEKRGILISYNGTEEVRNRDGSRTKRSALFFKPSDKYKEAFSTCGDLGRPTSYQLTSVTYDGDINVLNYTMAQKPSRPSWATDEIIEGWIELKYALEYGYDKFDIPFEIEQKLNDEKSYSYLH